MEYDKEKDKFFGETARYLPEEKDEAKQYLLSWKKFLLRRLQRDSYDVEIIDEHWIERPAYLDNALSNMEGIALKLCIRANWRYELK